VKLLFKGGGDPPDGSDTSYARPKRLASDFLFFFFFFQKREMKEMSMECPYNVEDYLIPAQGNNTRDFRDVLMMAPSLFVYWFFSFLFSIPPPANLIRI
jgi:hypothetical protein